MRFAKQAAADLSANRGSGLVLAGRSLSPETNALVHWINAHLQAPVDLIEPVGRTAGGRDAGSLSDLARALESGAVDKLVVIGANPGYDAPADLEFAKHAGKAAFRLHVGCYADETAALATWHVPQTHELEAWSDLRSVDGTASIVQPLIRPLYRTWTRPRGSGAAHGPRRRFVPRSRARDVEAKGRSRFRGLVDSRACTMASLREASPPHRPTTPSLPNVVAGCHACDRTPDRRVAARSKPVGRHVRQQCVAAGMSEAADQAGMGQRAGAQSARRQQRLGLSTGDVVTLAADGRQIEAPVVVEPGVADGVASLTLGLGRRNAGAIGNGIGANAYRDPHGRQTSGRSRKRRSPRPAGGRRS